MKIIYTQSNPTALSIDEVINALTNTGEKLLIGTKKVTSQISWAPDNKIEIITVSNKDHSIRNNIFCAFDGKSTIDWIRNKTYKNCNFYYGYFQD